MNLRKVTETQTQILKDNYSSVCILLIVLKSLSKVLFKSIFWMNLLKYECGFWKGLQHTEFSLSHA